MNKMPRMMYLALRNRVNRQRMISRGVQLGEGVQIHGNPLVSLAPDSTVRIGERSVLISSSRYTALGVSRPLILRTLLPGAELIIERDAGLSGTTICAASRVLIGARALIGADVLIADTSFHEIDAPQRRYLPLPQPDAATGVILEDDVFIGARAIIIGSVRIGHNSVVGAGSVVVRDIPPDSVAVGNPCRIVRELRT